MTKTAQELRGESYIDSRDVIATADELRREIADGERGEQELDESERALLDFADDGPYGEDWEHGASMIREDCFEDYARELAEDIGAIGRDMHWPLMHIDWEAAADALKVEIARSRPNPMSPEGRRLADQREDSYCRSLFNWGNYPTRRRRHGRRNRVPKR